MRERGAHGFSMDVLAKEGGVARATVYEHFRSKHALLDEHMPGRPGLELCRAAGATITTMETVVFDWLGGAGPDPVKRLSTLIR